jgi:uncharacterized membrane protein YhiD involved in acid resistance
MSSSCKRRAAAVMGRQARMNPITQLTTGIENLWWATYGIIAGWGLTFTVLVVVLVIVIIRTINLQRRIDRLEARLVHAERDYNLSINNSKSK